LSVIIPYGKTKTVEGEKYTNDGWQLWIRIGKYIYGEKDCINGIMFITQSPTINEYTALMFARE
jgi:hypothetical protein